MNDTPSPVAYRDGQHLTASLFRAEQEYHVSMRERHNLTGHEWGIAFGLTLENGAVSPGLAIDGYGRELVLAVRTQFDARAAFALYGVDSLDVHLVYERLVDPASDLAFERPRVLPLPADRDADRRWPHEVPVADLAFDATRAAPHDLAHPWPVYLGTLTKDPADPGGEPKVLVEGRPYLGVRAAAVLHPDGTRLDLQTGVSRPGQDEPVLGWDISADGTPAVRVGSLHAQGDVVSAGGFVFDASTSTPARTPSAGCRIERWHPEASGTPAAPDARGSEELRVVLADPAGGTGPSQFVVGAYIDGDFKPALTVDFDGKVTVHGNLVIEGDAPPESPTAEGGAK